MQACMNTSMPACVHACVHGCAPAAHPPPPPQGPWSVERLGLFVRSFVARPLPPPRTGWALRSGLNSPSPVEGFVGGLRLHGRGAGIAIEVRWPTTTCIGMHEGMLVIAYMYVCTPMCQNMSVHASLNIHCKHRQAMMSTLLRF